MRSVAGAREAGAAAHGSCDAGHAGAADDADAASRDGVAGANGTGLPSGTRVLISGDCPSGTTVDGTAYGWRVYSGNPFTGSGSELWISSCKVN
jgi:hypothetical protein